MKKKKKKKEKKKKTIPIPKKEKVTAINDLRLVALTPIVMKCLERIILKPLNKQIPPSLTIFNLFINRNVV